jgi:hypothetical protein
MDAEVIKIATSAWQHDAAGLNFFTRPRVMLDHDIVDALASTNSDAVALLVVLARYHGGNDRFALAKPMAASMGWTIARWKVARSALAVAGVIKCIHPGGRGPEGLRGANSYPNITYTLPLPLRPPCSRNLEHFRG